MNVISCKIKVVTSCVCVCVWVVSGDLYNLLRDVSAGRLQFSVFLIVWIYCHLMLKLSSCVSVRVFHYQEPTFLWTWVNFHRSGWPTWATPVTLAVSIATSDSAGSVVRLQIRRCSFEGRCRRMVPTLQLLSRWILLMVMISRFPAILVLCSHLPCFISINTVSLRSESSSRDQN